MDEYPENATNLVYTCHYLYLVNIPIQKYQTAMFNEQFLSLAAPDFLDF